MDTENVYKFRRYQAVPTHPGECGLEGWREGESLRTEEGKETGSTLMQVT